MVLALLLAILALVSSLSKLNTTRGDVDYSSISYDVTDPDTGGIKRYTETRIGSTVIEQQTVIDADGTNRIVYYISDDVYGFKAVMTKEPAAVATSTNIASLAPNIIPSAPLIANSFNPIMYTGAALQYVEKYLDGKYYPASAPKGANNLVASSSYTTSSHSSQTYVKQLPYPYISYSSSVTH